jgi:hypothetical protein
MLKQRLTKEWLLGSTKFLLFNLLRWAERCVARVAGAILCHGRNWDRQGSCLLAGLVDIWPATLESWERLLVFCVAMKRKSVWFPLGYHTSRRGRW